MVSAEHGDGAAGGLMGRAISSSLFCVLCERRASRVRLGCAALARESLRLAASSSTIFFEPFFCSPVSRFACRLHVLLPGFTVCLSVAMFATRFFFASRSERVEYSKEYPLFPFACRFDRVVDPGRDRVERKSRIPGSLAVPLPGFTLRYPKKTAILPGSVGKIFQIGNIIQKHTYCPGIDHE